MFAMNRALIGAGVYNLDEFRDAIETMDPQHYLASYKTARGGGTFAAPPPLSSLALPLRLVTHPVGAAACPPPPSLRSTVSVGLTLPCWSITAPMPTDASTAA